MSFYQKRVEADRRFGVSKVRPQDSDKSLMRSTRRNNLDLGFYTDQVRRGYKQRISEAIDTVEIKSLLPPRSTAQNWIPLPPPPTEFTETAPETEAVVQRCINERVVGFDLEFSNRDSFEGFISLCSLATGGQVHVIECIPPNRATAQRMLTQLLESTDCLKVVCGSDNDMIRVKKDWEALPLLVVDVQDMFVVWKTRSFEDVVKQCGNFYKGQLEGKDGVPKTEHEVMDALQKYDKPSLGFLAHTLLEKSFTKDEICTQADFSNRPLHNDLINYCGTDAAMTLKVFFVLALKIGTPGIKEALKMAEEKLMNTSGPAKPKVLKPNPQDNLVVARVKEWREYICKQLDRNAEKLISQRGFDGLCNELQSRPVIQQDAEMLANVLRRLRLSDEVSKAARLLVAYLEPSQERRNGMERILCHRCNYRGHTAFFCYKEMTAEEEREAKRAFRSRPENLEKHWQNNARRHRRYCVKRGLDPNVTPPPWAEDRPRPY